MRPTKKAQGQPKYPPLAAILRPTNLTDIIGQEHLLEENRPIHRMALKKRVMNTILWGPPGTGKTTLAMALSREIDAHFRNINATDTSIKEIRAIIDEAASDNTQQTVLFVDEIHRLNKSVKDAFLPVIEEGILTLFGATTENPKFSVNSTILSRSLVLETKPLNSEHLVKLLCKIKDYYKAHDTIIRYNKTAAAKLINRCSGDARKLVTAVEAAVIMMDDNEITEEIVDMVFPSKHVVFDKSGNEHFNMAHCYQDAIQDSDADGAIYWLAAWLNSGEDPAYICRRMLISAFEDCAGNPFAITSAMAACYATERTGMPECMIAMAQATCEMATSKRNKSAFYAIHAAMADVQNKRTVHILPQMRAGNNAYKRIINKKYVNGFEKDVPGLNPDA